VRRIAVLFVAAYFVMGCSGASVHPLEDLDLPNERARLAEIFERMPTRIGKLELTARIIDPDDRAPDPTGLYAIYGDYEAEVQAITMDTAVSAEERGDHAGFIAGYQRMVSGLAASESESGDTVERVQSIDHAGFLMDTFEATGEGEGLSLVTWTSPSTTWFFIAHSRSVTERDAVIAAFVKAASA
jgi:hypothetical protein